MFKTLREGDLNINIQVDWIYNRITELARARS